MINIVLRECATNLPRTSWSLGATLVDRNCSYNWSNPVFPSVNPIVKSEWSVLILGATIGIPPRPGQPPYIDNIYGSYAVGLWGESRYTIGGFWQVRSTPEPEKNFKNRGSDVSKPDFKIASPRVDTKHIHKNFKSGYVSAEIESAHY